MNHLIRRESANRARSHMKGEKEKENQYKTKKKAPQEGGGLCESHTQYRMREYI